MKKLLLLLLILKVSVFGLTTQQSYIKQLVLEEAPKYTRYKSTMAAICLTESSYGYYSVGDGGKSLGPMQIQVSTAKWLAKKDPTLRYLLRLSNKRVATLLLSSDRFSIMIACKLFEYHRKLHGYFGAISRYNGGAHNISYYTRVQTNKRKL